jgi:hypothetical protein
MKLVLVPTAEAAGTVAAEAAGTMKAEEVVGPVQESGEDTKSLAIDRRT